MEYFLRGCESPEKISFISIRRPFKNCGISSVLATGSRRSISASLCFLAISSPFVSIGATLQVDLLRQRAY